MAYRDDDSLDDDPENPDPADTDDSADDDQDLLERCPACRRMVYADAERCPHCGAYVTPGSGERRAWWVVAIVVLLALAFAVLALR